MRVVTHLMGTYQQFKALLVKNALLKRRKPISTFIFLVLPALFMLLIVWLHSFTESQYYPAAHHLDDTCDLSVDAALTTLAPRLALTDGFLAFAPAPAFASVVARLTDPAANVSLAEKYVRTFPTIADLDDYITSKRYGTAGYRNVYAAAIAPSGLLTGPDYAYTLRFNVSAGAYSGTPDTKRVARFNDVTPGYSASSFNIYCDRGYMALQLAIDTAILHDAGAYVHTTNSNEPQLQVVPMPTR